MEQTAAIICVIGVAVLLLFVLRELFCWYWKINTMVKNQEETNELLRKILSKGNPETKIDETQK